MKSSRDIKALCVWQLYDGGKGTVFTLSVPFEALRVQAGSKGEPVYAGPFLR